MHGFAYAVALVMASVLLWAGLEKARTPATTAGMLRQIGVPSRIAAPGAGLLIVAEIGTATALVLRPASAVALLGVAALALAFAAAGLIGLRRAEPVRCHCFGAGGRGYLGRRQLAALPLWLAGIAAVWQLGPVALSASEAAVALASVALALAALRMPAALRAWQEARGDRRSAEETYAWL